MRLMSTTKGSFSAASQALSMACTSPQRAEAGAVLVLLGNVV
jgi:hypothetical protein